MGCGCKKEIKKVTDPKTGEVKEKRNFKESLFVRILTFIVILVFIPIIVIALIVILFKKFFITGEVNLIQTGVDINKTFSKKEKIIENDSEDENEYEYHNIYAVEKIN